MASSENLKPFVQQVRRDILRQVHAVNSGHPGGSLGCAEFFSVLFKEVMEYDPNFDPDGKNEDIFFLSNGHISPVYYSVLARCGFFDVKELHTFRKINSRLQGHPTTHEGLPGIRIASGSLGQGMSVSIGAAQTKKLNKDQHLVYSLHGDGELQEGQNWEAVMYAGSKGIDNLISTIDHNGQQIDGSTKDVMPLNNVKDKFLAFDWQVVEVEDGNDIDQIRNALAKAKDMTGKGKPTAIILNTVMGNGVDYMMHTHAWHGKAPDDELLEKGLAQNPETIGDY
jgi:transketolase